MCLFFIIIFLNLQFVKEKAMMWMLEHYENGFISHVYLLDCSC